MNPKPEKTPQIHPPRWYRGADVPIRAIRRFTRQVVDEFHPDKIVLFGSHAYGTPHADSDVDILVIMPTRNELDQAFKIHSTLLPPFPLDIIVRTPTDLAWRLAEGDSFHTEAMTKGKVLYEKDNSAVGAQGRVGLSHGKKKRRR